MRKIFKNRWKRGTIVRDRSAVSTIKGYFYQFDSTILNIFELKENHDSITIEGIEDFDISDDNGFTAVQCKYYSETEYNHSLIAEAVRFMLKDFKERKNNGKDLVNYKLYGYYQKGQDKLPESITIEFLKQHFLTYTHNKVKHNFEKQLNLTDIELIDFITCLQIDIRAEDYSQQIRSVLLKIQEYFNCSSFEAEHYYYNSALKVIKEYAVKKDSKERVINKKTFIQSIDKKEILFNEWFILYKSQKEIFVNLRRQYFTSLNVYPFERFFLIDVDHMNYLRTEIKDIIYFISNKWSKLSKRTPSPFCPYIYIHNIGNKELIDLKNDLYSEGFRFEDGFPFHGSKFEPKAIVQPTNFISNVRIKIIDNLDFLDLALNEISATKEVYQFFRVNPYYENTNPQIKHVKIQNVNLGNLREII